MSDSQAPRIMDRNRRMSEQNLATSSASATPSRFSWMQRSARNLRHRSPSPIKTFTRDLLTRSLRNSPGPQAQSPTCFSSIISTGKKTQFGNFGNEHDSRLPSAATRLLLLTHQRRNQTQFITSRSLPEIKGQLGEQLKCLEAKLEVDNSVLQELQDFYRKRSALEQKYCESLNDLVKQQTKHMSDVVKKSGNWAPYTASNLLNVLVASTLHTSQTHGTMAEVFSKQMCVRLHDIADDLQRLHRQCRDIMRSCHEEIVTSVTQLQEEHRVFLHQNEQCREAKKAAQKQRDKVTAAEDKARSKNKDPNRIQSIRKAREELDSRNQHLHNMQVLAYRARNAYLVQLAGTNNFIHRYFDTDVNDLLDCVDIGFHNGCARAMLMHCACEEAVKDCHSTIIEWVNQKVSALDMRQDRRIFLTRYESAFLRPPLFSVTESDIDSVGRSVLCEESVRESLHSYNADLDQKLKTFKMNMENFWKILERMEQELLLLINQPDYDVVDYFAENSSLFGEFAGDIRRKRSITGNSGSPFEDPISSSSPQKGSTAYASTLSLGSAGGQTAPTTPTENKPNGSSVSDLGPFILYTQSRDSNRKARIESERFYLETFRQHMLNSQHYDHTVARIQQIQKCLAKSEAAATYDAKHIPGGIPVLPSGNFQTKSEIKIFL
ncbi:SLIT-ROBO Rho GTPase-activating protein 1 [Cichlidogyrus casuarinus]|uniref:SLIT-ROBO Rho GTPase-activating protein 1 n=1 Tax=Cichlidogyrus casuarinus TaxID=1844966 RepID=A0ABD2Q943_9PLAT